MKTEREIRIDARKYENHDNCLAAAAAEYARGHGLQGWDLTPRWADNSRAEIVLTVPITRECRSCVYVPDSYEVDAEGKCRYCKDTKIEIVTDCDGCDSPQPDLKLYLVTFHDGGEQEVYYCDDCAELARVDWNGETKSITPKPEG